MTGIDWTTALAPLAAPIVVMPASDTAALAAAVELEVARPSAIVRAIDAADCATSPEFLRALGSALEFPEGSVNWNVVSERLYDMTWFPDADAFVVVMLHCELFETASSAPDLMILDQILTGIDDDRAEGRALVPRLLVCQCDPARYDAFIQLLHGCGVDWPAAPFRR